MEPGNQAPMKIIGSGKIFSRSSAMQQVKRAKLIQKSEFFLLQLIYHDKKRFVVPRITLI